MADPAGSTSDSMSADRRQQLFVNFVIGLKGTRVQAKMLSTRNIILEKIRDIGHSMNSATCKANLDSSFLVHVSLFPKQLNVETVVPYQSSGKVGAYRHLGVAPIVYYELTLFEFVVLGSCYSSVANGLDRLFAIYILFF